MKNIQSLRESQLGNITLEKPNIHTTCYLDILAHFAGLLVICYSKGHSQIGTMDTKESLLEHNFAVIITGILLNTDNPVDCIIKYQHVLFSPSEKSTGEPFTIQPGNTEEVPISKPSKSVYEHTVPSTYKESEVKKSMQDNPMYFKVFDKEIQLGIATVSLHQLQSDEAEKVPFGLRYQTKVPIMSDETTWVGRISLVFILDTEACTNCKACKKIYKKSTFLKHIAKSKSCKDQHSEEEMEEFRSQAKERKRKQELRLAKQKYDPRKRAEYHKATYVPKKIFKTEEEKIAEFYKNNK